MRHLTGRPLAVHLLTRQRFVQFSDVLSERNAKKMTLISVVHIIYLSILDHGRTDSEDNADNRSLARASNGVQSISTKGMYDVLPRHLTTHSRQREAEMNGVPGNDIPSP